MAKKKTTRKMPAKKASDCCEASFKAKFPKKMADCCKTDNCGCSGFAYFLGFVGAAAYYLSTATGFWNGVWGVIKALLWPAFLVYEALGFLGLQ